MVGKVFESKNTGKQYTVESLDGNIATLNNNERITSARLMDSNYYEEVVQIDNFNSTTSLKNTIMAGLKNINPSNYSDNVDTSSYVRIIEAVDDKGPKIINPQVEAAQQEELFRKYFTPEQVAAEKAKAKPIPFPNFESGLEQTEQVIISNNINPLFSGLKRATPFKIDFSLNEMIPRLDFIEMWEESYNDSIIEYLANEFTNKILSNPLEIKKSIMDKLVRLLGQHQIPKKATKSASQMIDEEITAELKKPYKRKLSKKNSEETEK